MLPTQAPPVKPSCPASKPSSSWKDIWLWGTCVPTCGKDLRTFSILFALPALLIWLLHLDTPIARAVYQPAIGLHSNHAATFLRQYGTLPGAALTLFGLIVLLWPRMWRVQPLLYRFAVVVTFTAILGVGFANQIVVKKLADRTRPNETVLLASPLPDPDGFRGNSMPSGHAAMGFLLAAPFFPLRRERPKLAATFLATGLVSGAIIGLSRMALGAHFATDVLVAGLITFSAAAFFNRFAESHPRISHTRIALGAFLCLIAVVLGNRFNNLTLTTVLAQPFTGVNLPCTPEITPLPGLTTQTLTVRVTGYGAPLSTLKLKQHAGYVTLKRHWGLYHHLTCTATLAVPLK